MDEQVSAVINSYAPPLSDLCSEAQWVFNPQASVRITRTSCAQIGMERGGTEYPFFLKLSTKKF